MGHLLLKFGWGSETYNKYAKIIICCLIKIRHQEGTKCFCTTLYVFSNFIPDFDTKVCIKKNWFSIFPEAQHWQRTASLCSPPRQLSEYAGSNVSKKKKEGGREGNTEIPPSSVQEEQSPVLSPAGKKGKGGHLFYCKHTISQQLLHEPHIPKLRLQIPVESRKNPPNRMKSGDRQTKCSWYRHLTFPCEKLDVCICQRLPARWKASLAKFNRPILAQVQKYRNKK